MSQESESSDRGKISRKKRKIITSTSSEHEEEQQSISMNWDAAFDFAPSKNSSHDKLVEPTSSMKKTSFDLLYDVDEKIKVVLLPLLSRLKIMFRMNWLFTPQN